ncbi:synaptonemal complex central element protein 2-like [Dysidea avara]|uniref:synaptonemal complex central element protein 2-like n=1 Tax=Dysidea avara TaxID=196820 RepID=UPI003333B256
MAAEESVASVVTTQSHTSTEAGFDQGKESLMDSGSRSYPEESRDESYTNTTVRQSWQLRQTLEGVVKEINAKRERDGAILTDFKKELEVQAADTYNKVEKALYNVYEENSSTINEKLEELFATLDRIGKLEVELEGFMSNLKLLISDIQGDTLGSLKNTTV